jgi:DNA-binding MarR family transcriptional regulator
VATELSKEALTLMFDVSLSVRILRSWEQAHAARTAEFSERELLALEIIEQFPEVTESELANILGLASSSASELVRRLGSAGVVGKTGSDSSTRGRPLTLTKKGSDVLESLKERSAARFQFLFQECGEAEFKALLDVLKGAKRAVMQRLNAQVFNVLA